MAKIGAGGTGSTDDMMPQDEEDEADASDTDTESTASEASTEEEQLKEGFDVDTLKDETTTRRERDSSTTTETADSDETSATNNASDPTGGFEEETLKDETETGRERAATEQAREDDGFTDAQRQEATADIARVSSDLRSRLQGAETGAGAVASQARELEARVLEAYSQLDASDVAVTREGNVLRAELTATGREAFGINPTQRELAARRKEIGMQLGGSIEAYKADRGRARELSQAEEIGATLEGIRRAVDATGQEFDRVADARGPVRIEDLTADQQREVNEALVKQYSEQKSAFEQRQSRGTAEQFGGTSAPERFLRAASQSYSEFVEDATTFGEDNNLTFAVRPASTAGPFPGTVSVATLEEESESQRAQATRGLATGGAEVFNAPAYGVLGIEAGEIAVAGGEAAASGGFGGYEAVEGVAMDALEYSGLREESTASAADRDPAIDESFVEELGTAGIGLTDRVVTTAQEQPARFGGQLVGGTAAASGALSATKAVAGSRAATAVDVAFDPATPVTRGLRSSTRRAGARARRAADEFVSADRGQFTPGTKLEVEAETETAMKGKEKMIEVEEGSEVEQAMLAEREAFLERTRVKESSGDVEMNVEAGRYDVGETRMERERVDSEAETAEERLPPPSEFESEAAYENELEAMRERMAAESEVDADAATGVETTSGVGMETAAVLTGGSLATSAEADDFETPTEEATATVAPFVTQESLSDMDVATEADTSVGTAVDVEQETERIQEQELEQEQDLTQEVQLEFEREQELEQEFEQETELEFEQELELEQETETETEIEIELEAESEAELEMEAVDEDMLTSMDDFDARNRKAGLFENDVISPEELDDFKPVD